VQDTKFVPGSWGI